MGGKIAISQSNYIPWKGYFDMIAAVDDFILYDDVQYTKNDWRNRNRIKTPQGAQWLTVPVGQDINRCIRDVILPSPRWQIKHWKSLESNYRRAPYFDEVAEIIEPLYLRRQHAHLSTMNREFIELVCNYLGITTRITSSSDYQLAEGTNGRLINLCNQLGATCYFSGPAALEYIDQDLFADRGIEITWFDYTGYPEYVQLWNGFIHEVTVLDLLFNAGKESANYLKTTGS